MSSEPASSTDSTRTSPHLGEDVMTPLQQYIAYPFDADDVYQQGLASILAGGAIPANATPQIRDEILRRTRVFYFNKQTGFNLSMDEVREYEISLRQSTTSAPAMTAEGDSNAEEERVLTFAELKELIESGKVDQIPNNKLIPEKFTEEAPSQSTAPVRKKPWEAAHSNEQPGSA